MNKSPDPHEPHSYIVRIYRQSLQGVVGQIEDVQTGLVRSFRSAGELWRAIGGKAPRYKTRRSDNTD